MTLTRFWWETEGEETKGIDWKECNSTSSLTSEGGMGDSLPSVPLDMGSSGSPREVNKIQGKGIVERLEYKLVQERQAATE